MHPRIIRSAGALKSVMRYGPHAQHVGLPICDIVKRHPLLMQAEILVN